MSPTLALGTSMMTDMDRQQQQLCPDKASRQALARMHLATPAAVQVRIFLLLMSFGAAHMLMQCKGEMSH